MDTSQARFLEPLDVLFLRGNRLFGEAGSFGDSMLPPWPSVAAGALRSHVFAATGEILDDAERFRLTDFRLARRNADGIVEPLFAVPADLALHDAAASGDVHVSALHPATPAAGIQGSFALSHVPLLAADQRAKPATGYWLSAAGWQQYLHGKVPTPAHLVSSKDLWKTDFRIGIGMDEHTRSAQDAKLFSMQAIAFAAGAGFWVGFAGSEEIGTDATLRLGGDGRGARMHTADPATMPQPDLEAIAASGRARLVLTTPGLFPEGWLLPGMAADGSWQLAGVRARVTAAAVPRAQVISGWDLVKRQPKPAQRAAPTGSVYWLENLEASVDALRKLADHGLWLNGDDTGSRRIEGYNRFHFAAA